LQSKVNFEILIGDNGSDDGSDFLLEKTYANEKRVCIVRNNANLGFSKANNLLIEKASGDYLLFLNPDCIVKQDTLSNMLTYLENDEKVGMAGCLIRNPDGSEQAGSRRHIPTPWRSFVSVFGLSRIFKNHPNFNHIAMNDQPLPEQPVSVEAISGAFMFVRRSAMEKVGGMDENYFIHCEDLDWCMAFRKAGWRILFVPDVEIMHVKGVPTASHPYRVEYHKHRGMIFFYKKFFRYQYPGILMWLVTLSVWVRFIGRSLKIWLSSLFKVPATPWKGQPDTLSSLEPSGQEMSSGKTTKETVLVTGATNQIGHFLLPLLIEKDFHVHAISRSKEQSNVDPRITWHQADIGDNDDLPTVQATMLIHLAPLHTLPALLPQLSQHGIKRIIAFSTTSRFTKANSKNEKEQHIAKEFTAAENDLANTCKKLGIDWTVFRPTLVYGCGRDKNISDIISFIKRFGFFPLVGKAHGLRQPVHAEDLAQACLQAASSETTQNKSYNLSGGNTLSYHAMVETIFQAMDKKTRIIHIPRFIYKIFLFCLSHLPGYNHITPEMADRMNQDLCFDHQEAVNDFGYSPRPFASSQINTTH